MQKSVIFRYAVTAFALGALSLVVCSTFLLHSAVSGPVQSPAVRRSEPAAPCPQTPTVELVDLIPLQELPAFVDTALQRLRASSDTIRPALPTPSNQQAKKTGKPQPQVDATIAPTIQPSVIPSSRPTDGPTNRPTRLTAAQAVRCIHKQEHHTGFDIKGFDIKGAVHTSMRQFEDISLCCEYCSSTPACGGFTWKQQATGGTCFPKEGTRQALQAALVSKVVPLSASECLSMPLNAARCVSMRLNAAYGVSVSVYQCLSDVLVCLHVCQQLSAILMFLGVLCAIR